MKRWVMAAWIAAFLLGGGFTPGEEAWPRTSFEAEGLDPARWRALEERVEVGTFRQIRGVLVIKNGKLLAESYFGGSGPDELVDIRSAGKSYAAVLMGIAIDKGFVPGVDEKLYDYFPEVSLTPDDPKRDITLHQTLAMSFGLAEPDGVGRTWDWPPTWNENWIEEVLALPLHFEPGSRFEYHSAAPSLVAPIIRRASGMTVPEFAEQYLFGPLGIERYEWGFCPDGHAITQGSFRTRPRDMAKIGQLHLQGGRWGDVQVLSPEWVELSTREHLVAIPDLEVGYGYYWWTERWRHEGRWVGSYSASGNGGNKIIVFPELELVVVVTATAYDAPWNHLQVRAMVQRYVLPAVMTPAGEHAEMEGWRSVPRALFALLGLVFLVSVVYWPARGVAVLRSKERAVDGLALATGAAAFFAPAVAGFALLALTRDGNLEWTLNSGYPFTPQTALIVVDWLLVLFTVDVTLLTAVVWFRERGTFLSRLLAGVVAVSCVGLLGLLAHWELLFLVP